MYTLYQMAYNSFYVTEFTREMQNLYNLICSIKTRSHYLNSFKNCKNLYLNDKSSQSEEYTLRYCTYFYLLRVNINYEVIFASLLENIYYIQLQTEQIFYVYLSLRKPFVPQVHQTFGQQHCASKIQVHRVYILIYVRYCFSTNLKYYSRIKFECNPILTSYNVIRNEEK